MTKGEGDIAALSPGAKQTLSAALHSAVCVFMHVLVCVFVLMCLIKKIRKKGLIKQTKTELYINKKRTKRKTREGEHCNNRKKKIKYKRR